MQAYLVDSPDAPFTLADLPRPSCTAAQVLVRIHASGVNPLDTKIRAGKASHAQQPLPAVLGVEMAGVVEEVGVGVNNFRTDDEVYVGVTQETLLRKRIYRIVCKTNRDPSPVA